MHRHHNTIPSGLRACRAAVLLLPLVSLVGCASPDRVQERVDRRTGAMSQMQQNADIRQKARDQRYDAAWEAMMH
jgi:hypothetical protein